MLAVFNGRIKPAGNGSKDAEMAAKLSLKVMLE